MAVRGGRPSRFYRISLTTGRAVGGRSFDPENEDVASIAIPLDQR
jgi:hypothetical protein